MNRLLFKAISHREVITLLELSLLIALSLSVNLLVLYAL